LIKVHQTICNDFELTKHNQVNLITGSNMSGKSTFLRTIGMNLILANMGAPVFAEKLDLRLGMEPICYMRITDSIYENASTFKAEIERIKLVLQALKNDKLHIFLIDEMLRGTNSEDKLKGSMALFEKLVNENAIALLATHDLRLSEISAKYTDKVKNFYFEYSTAHGELIFDYLIKEGVCKSFNASLLLEAIGLKMNP
jgi:DNA mismatch repair ATPase MutS